MKIEDLLIPARHVDLFYALIARNGGVSGVVAKDELVMSKEAVVELFVRLGARGKVKNESGVGKNEKMNENNENEGQRNDNQGDGYAMPKALLEEWGKEGKNLIRAVMDHKDLQLKSVAEKYGGKSAAANLSNFLAKSDEELAAMRTSTMQRLATALDCPVEWLLQLKAKK